LTGVWDLWSTSGVSKKIGATVVLLGIMVLVLVLPLAARAESLQLRKETVQARREQLREEIKNRVTEFRTKLLALKDARKKTTVENINTRMCKINVNQMGVLKDHLDRIAVVIDRVEERSAVLKSEGKDTAVIEAAIVKARKAVADGGEAVDAQGQKECVIAISGSDTTVGAEVRNSISKLEAEIKAVRVKVQAARQAATQAVKTLAQTL